MNEEQVRTTVELILSHPAHLIFYCASTGTVFLDGRRAAQDFFQRAAMSDMSPVRFFDPGWFRSRYRVTAANAFLSDLQNPQWRFAVPSPVFAPRWYARRYSLPSSVHPLLDFLLCAEDRNPHPLLDVKFLKQQSSSWNVGSIALEYLTDVQRFRLKPHPLFDTQWYLLNNPDVAAAAVNPLEHYLQFGHAEGRTPNRLFSIKWYRDKTLDQRRDANTEPLTSYVTTGMYQGATPAPGLDALTKPSVRLTEYGPAPYLHAVEHDRSLHAVMRHRPVLHDGVIGNYLSSCLHDFNPLLPRHTVLLRKQRIALMYSYKCASARIVYWWLDQKNLLEAALSFSEWSHSFENIYRNSRDYVQDALTFDPAQYHVYKFVRNPLWRAASSFTQLLHEPKSFNIPAGETQISFMEFLDRVASTNFWNGDGHCIPQRLSLEGEGKVVPRVLKIEDGLNSHLRSLEAAHALRASNYQKHHDVDRNLEFHAKQNRANISVGPDIRIPYRSTPDYRALLTPGSI